MKIQEGISLEDATREFLHCREQALALLGKQAVSLLMLILNTCYTEKRKELLLTLV